eukprot:3233706-Amphidinium_carterae.1
MPEVVAKEETGRSLLMCVLSRLGKTQRRKTSQTLMKLGKIPSLKSLSALTSPRHSLHFRWITFRQVTLFCGEYENSQLPPLELVHALAWAAFPFVPEAQRRAHAQPFAAICSWDGFKCIGTLTNVCSVPSLLQSAWICGFMQHIATLNQ